MMVTSPLGLLPETCTVFLRFVLETVVQCSSSASEILLDSNASLAAFRRLSAGLVGGDNVRTPPAFPAYRASVGLGAATLRGVQVG
jgi:hypothetical protein